MILKNANQLLVINSNWYNKYINYDTRQEDSETREKLFSRQLFFAI
jgi:hypothetical protein